MDAVYMMVPVTALLVGFVVGWLADAIDELWRRDE